MFPHLLRPRSSNPGNFVYTQVKAWSLQMTSLPSFFATGSLCWANQSFRPCHISVLKVLHHLNTEFLSGSLHCCKLQHLFFDVTTSCIFHFIPWKNTFRLDFQVKVPTSDNIQSFLTKRTSVKQKAVGVALLTEGRLAFFAGGVREGWKLAALNGSHPESTGPQGRLKAKPPSLNAVAANIVWTSRELAEIPLSHGALAHQSRDLVFLTHAEEAEVSGLPYGSMEVHCKGFLLSVSIFHTSVLLMGKLVNAS